MFIPISQKVNELLEKERQDARKVIMIHPVTINIIKIFNSASEAVRITGFDLSSISSVCRGESIQAYGYFWKYLDEYFKEMYSGDYFIKGYPDPNDNSIIKTQFKCSIFDFIVYNNLSNYIQPCFNYNYYNNHVYGIEIWLDILGYEGLYKISNYGRVISLINYPYIYEMKLQLDKDGYYYVNLYDKNGNSRSYRVHRLVAQAFIPNPNNYPCINHKDENKINNYVSNLEWCTVEYNCNYGSRNQKSAINRGKSVQQIDLNTGEVTNEFCSINEASRVTGINSSCIRDVIYKRQKSAGGFGWSFKEIKPILPDI